MYVGKKKKRRRRRKRKEFEKRERKQKNTVEITNNDTELLNCTRYDN